MLGIRLEFQVLVNHQAKSENLLRNTQTINRCPFYNRSTIAVPEENEYYNLHDYDTPFYLSNIRFPTRREKLFQQDQIDESNILYQNRYLIDEWFEFEGTLVHEFRNRSPNKSLLVQADTAFLEQVQPILHSMSQSPGVAAEHSFEIQQSNKYSKLRFKFVLAPNQTFEITIPFWKKMKSFENYPHDPARGHDLISGTVLYQIPAHSKQTYHQYSNNLVVKLPEPDFSMPFNIITYVCVLFGYLYMQFVALSVGKVKN